MADKFENMTDEELDAALLNDLSDEELDARLLSQSSERPDMEQRIEVPEDVQSSNLIEAAKAGGIKSVANALQTAENASRILQEYSPPGHLAKLITGKVYQEGPIGKTAKKLTEYADTKIPERKGVLANVVEGGVQVPEKLAELALVPGGLLTKLMIQGAVGGAQEGIGGMTIGAGTNAILGSILGATSKIMPSKATTSIVPKVAAGVTRALIGGGSGAALEAVQGATKEGGTSSDKVAAEGILGALLSIPTGNSTSIVDDVKNFTSNMIRAKASHGALQTVAKHRSSQVEKVKGEISSLEKEASNKISAIDKSSKEYESVLADEQSTKLKSKQELEESAKLERDQQVFAENVDLANKLNNLDANILQVVKTNALNLKEPFKQQFRQYSKDYDKRVWEPAAKKFDKETPLTYDQMTDLLHQVKSESMNDADVNFGRNFGLINEWIQKYNPGTDPNNPRIGKDGQPEILQDATIPFKKLVFMVRQMAKNVNFKDRAKPDDIPYFIFKRAVGDIITGGDPNHEFAIGQKAYSKVIESMKLASKMFEIYKPSTESAERRLMSVAKKGDVLSGQQERVQKFLTEGTPEFPSRSKSNKFSKLESLGKQRGLLDEVLKSKSFEKKAQTNYERRMGEIQNEINQITREINDKKISLKNSTDEAKGRVLGEVMSRINSLNNKILDLSYIKQKTKSGKDISVHIDKIKANNERALRSRRKLTQLIQDIALVIGSGGIGANRMMLYQGVKSVKDLGTK